MPLGKTADFVLPFWQLQFLKFLGLMQLNAIKCKGLKQWKVYNVYKLCFHLVQSIQPSLPRWLAKLARLSCWCALVSAWWSQSRSKKWLQWFHQKIMPIPGSPQLFHHFHVAFICFYVVCYFTVVTIRSGRVAMTKEPGPVPTPGVNVQSYASFREAPDRLAHSDVTTEIPLFFERNQV